MLHLNAIVINSIVFAPEFVWGENRDIQSFHLNAGLTKNITLQYLLTKINLPNITHLGISGHLFGSEWNTLAPDNLTNFDKNLFTTLQLRNCGIETVLSQTFDSIGSYLRYLDLDHNKIKHIYLEQFGSFLVGTKSNKILSFIGNQIECDCDYHLLKTVWYFNFRSRSLQEIEGNCLNDRTRLNWTEECRNMQIIDVHKLHVNSSEMGFNALFYPKITLKLDRSTNDIVFKTNINSTFKVIIVRFWSHESKVKVSYRCWQSQNTKCWLLKSGISRFQDQFYAKSELTFVSVIHLTYLRVWPLHLMTIRTVQPESTISLIRNFSGISFFGLMIGFIGVICFMKLRK